MKRQPLRKKQKLLNNYQLIKLIKKKADRFGGLLFLTQFFRDLWLTVKEVKKDQGRSDDVADRVAVEQRHDTARCNKVYPDDTEETDPEQVRNCGHHHVVLCPQC